MLPFEVTQEFDAAQDLDFFAALPAKPGVFLLEMADASAAPYLAQTADIRRAAERLLRAPEANSKRLNLRSVAARIRYRVTGSKFERSFAIYQQTRALFPHRYRDRLRLRPPALLKVNLRNSYPRCYVTRRISADQGFYFGPFPSRKAADSFNEGVLDLFKIRRCQIKIRCDPTFPGCVYSEMKMCMAPCFGGCTKGQYDADVGSLVSMLASRGSALVRPLEHERESASGALDFERAAGLHKRIEKIKSALRALPEIASRIDRLDAVILQRGVGEKVIAVFPLVGGILAEPLLLDFGQFANEPRSAEAVLREAFQSETNQEEQKPVADAASSAADRPSSSTESIAELYGLSAPSAERSEHLSIVARWFFSNPREGEILFREGDWPYRRILRACNRLLALPSSTDSSPAPLSKDNPPRQVS